jgi:hypothetical protein
VRTISVAIGVVMLAVLGIAAGTARSAESKVQLNELPKGGLDAVKGMFPKGLITGAAKETEDDKTVYEVTLKEMGRTIDVTIGTDGQIQVVEREIASKDLPVAVRRALEGRYPQAIYKIVERVEAFKAGKASLDFFEVLLQTSGGQTIEVQIAPDGTIKAEEKKQADKD